MVIRESNKHHKCKIPHDNKYQETTTCYMNRNQNDSTYHIFAQQIYAQTFPNIMLAQHVCGLEQGSLVKILQEGNSTIQRTTETREMIQYEWRNVYGKV